MPSQPDRFVHSRKADPNRLCRSPAHPAACTVPVPVSAPAGLAALTALADAEPAVTIAGWLICPPRWAKLLATRRHWRWRTACGHPAPADYASDRQTVQCPPRGADDPDLRGAVPLAACAVGARYRIRASSVPIVLRPRLGLCEW